MDAKIDAAQAAQRLFKQAEAGRQVAALDGQNAAEATLSSRKIREPAGVDRGRVAAAASDWRA